MIGGAMLLAGYVRHALGAREPLIDLRLLRLSTFRYAIAGGTIFRVGIGALPFLLPLMFQLGFGLSPFQSGMLTFASGAGAIRHEVSGAANPPPVRFRRTLAANAVLSGLFLLFPAFFTPETPWLAMVGLLFVGGCRAPFSFTSIMCLDLFRCPGRAPEQRDKLFGCHAGIVRLDGRDDCRLHAGDDPADERCVRACTRGFPRGFVV